MTKVGFITVPLGIQHERIEPDNWDRQTLAILFNNLEVGKILQDQIRREHKPVSTSIGDGYSIDIYVNMNYEKWEKDPALRNIRVVYCDMTILSEESVNKRFPNAYIIRVETEKGSVRVEPRIES